MQNTPRTARGRDSRDRIVTVAAGLMQSGGVEGTSIDAILAAAGASKSQLYHYFTDRQGLSRAGPGRAPTGSTARKSRSARR